MAHEVVSGAASHPLGVALVVLQTGDVVRVGRGVGEEGRLHLADVPEDHG